MKKRRRPKGKIPRIRTRAVDFMRIEHARGGDPLTEFELKVQKELAVGPSPLDILIREEEEREQDENEALYREAVRRIKLTERQSACFERAIVRGMPQTEVADALGLDRTSVRRHLDTVQGKLVKLIERLRQGKGLKADPRFALLTEREQQFFRLYYEELLSASEIARRFQVQPSTVFLAIKHIAEHKLKNRT